MTYLLYCTRFQNWHTSFCSTIQSMSSTANLKMLRGDIRIYQRTVRFQLSNKVLEHTCIVRGTVACSSNYLNKVNIKWAHLKFKPYQECPVELGSIPTDLPLSHQYVSLLVQWSLRECNWAPSSHQSKIVWLP